MKQIKLSLANIQGKLSRAEMKKIMAGSGDGQCGTFCSNIFLSCVLHCGGTSVTGTCRSNSTGGSCYCAGAC